MLLFLYNCSSPVNPETRSSLGNVRIAFLPSTTTSLPKAIDAGVIASFKRVLERSNTSVCYIQLIYGIPIFIRSTI